MSDVAVIIPAYNAERWIGETIQSVLAQSHAPASICVVDDGSSDGTRDQASKFGEAVTLLSQKNAGVCTARNNGAASVSAEWLLFLDADDRLRPDALEILRARAGQGSFGATYGCSVDFRVSGQFGESRGNGVMEGAPPSAARASFWKAPITTPGMVLIRREVFESVGKWNPAFNTTADRDLWCRIGAVAEFGFSPEIVLERRLHDENMSSDKNRARQQAVEVQLAFMQWCAERGIDPGFLGTSEMEILERNGERAIQERAIKAAKWIVQEAKQRGFKSRALSDIQRLASMPALGREVELRVKGFLKR